MIIKRLVLHNFGIYAGTNMFEFHGEKPVVLIGGMNGRGKTTFLEAVLLSLYGLNSFAYTEGKFSTYGQYLKSFVNKTDGTNLTYVELEFTLTDSETYIVKRKWKGDMKRVHESITVKLNGENNSFLTENWSMFIENILPSGLSNFFFFDGEKIAALAEEDTNEQMKESIRTLLGINIVDRLESDLKKINNKVEKENTQKFDVKESNRLKEEKDEAESNLEELDHKIVELGDKIAEIEKKIEVEKVNYTTKGGDIVEKKQELLQEKALISAKIHSVEEQLKEISASAFPLIMTKDLLKKIERQVKEEKKNKENELVARKISELYNAYSSGNKFDGIEKFMDYIESNIRVKNVDDVYNFSDISYFQICSLNDSLLHELKCNVQKNIEEKRKLHEKADDIDSYLSVEIDKKAINKIYKKILKLEKEKAGFEVERDVLIHQRVNLNGELIKATFEFNQYVEKMLAALEMEDDNDRIIKYTHKVAKVLDIYKIRLQQKKIKVLAETMTSCYKQLANKKTLINSIQMDPETLDFYYYNDQNDIVPKNRLSAGEKQLMVVALLWSLAICSKRKLPVIIDTPLSRLDSLHRVALIKTYFPNASDQTIILSTDSEIFGEYYEALKENVGDEYTLRYDDVTKSTTIKEGYQMEEVKW